MGDNFLTVDIVLFAVVAAFLFLRLRSVLGRRTGHEQQRPNPFARQPADQRPMDKRPDGPMGEVRPLPITPRPEVVRPRPEPEVAARLSPAASGVAEIKLSDPQFDEDQFLGGARVAFEMIVEAFARGDLQSLRPLLADDVFEKFAGAIKARQAAGETLETTLEGIRIIDIVEARLDNRIAIVTVKFVSDQINLLRDRNGGVLDGEPGHPVEVVDLWTFSRNTKARDPNWTLIATRTPH